MHRSRDEVGLVADKDRIRIVEFKVAEHASATVEEGLIAQKTAETRTSEGSVGVGRVAIVDLLEEFGGATADRFCVGASKLVGLLDLKVAQKGR